MKDLEHLLVLGLSFQPLYHNIMMLTDAHIPFPQRLGTSSGAPTQSAILSHSISSGKHTGNSSEQPGMYTDSSGQVDSTASVGDIFMHTIHQLVHVLSYRIATYSDHLHACRQNYHPHACIHNDHKIIIIHVEVCAVYKYHLYNYSVQRIPQSLQARLTSLSIKISIFTGVSVFFF